MTKYLFYNAAPFDTSDVMFNKNADTCYHRVLGFFFVSEFLALRFFLRLIRLDMIWFVLLEPGILQEPTGGKRLLFVITNTFVVDTPGIGVAEILHTAIFHIDNKVVFHGMRFFLPLYWSCCWTGSVGRCTRRSVPSMMKSTETHMAKTCARFWGAHSGKPWACPKALCKTSLSVCIHSFTRP